MIQTQRQLSQEYGFTLFDVGDPRQGIVHIVASEQGLALPGLTVTCADSHACTLGGVGALAWGIGASDGEHVLTTQTMAQVKPKTMLVTFGGRLAPGVASKDVILHLIGKHGANGGLGYAVEYAGPVVRSMSIEQRLTLCNMSIEFSANYGFVPPDDLTFAYLEGRPFAPKGQMWEDAVAYWRTLPSDPGVTYDREIGIDCSTLAPQLTWGTSPQQVLAVDDRVPDPSSIADPGTRKLHERALEYMQLTPGAPIEGLKIDAAYIGSCTNSRLSDLRDAAAVLKGRKIAPGIKALCVPGSTTVKNQAEFEGLDRIFTDAGFEWHESGCGMCSSDGGPVFTDRRVISTTNRSFEGRQGTNTRTHLASPATVAASAIAGHIFDVRRTGG